MLLNIFYHINFNLNVKNNFEDVYVIKYKPMSFSADFIKDGKVNFRTQPSLKKSGLRVVDNRESNLTYSGLHNSPPFADFRT